MNPPQDATVATPNGGVAVRCTGTTKNGARCSKPARRGYATCATHQAEGEATVETGERRGPGRPATHGLYSRMGATSIRELRDQVSSLEIDLDDTDEELKTVKSVLWFLLGQAEKYEGKTLMLETALTAIENVLETAKVVHKGVPADGELSVAQARQLGAQLAAGYRLVAEINGWTGRLLDSNLRAISAVKMRAETSAKLAEQKSVEAFAGLAGQITRIIWELAPDSDWLDVYEDRLRRDVLGPNRLELPDADDVRC